MAGIDPDLVSPYPLLDAIKRWIEKTKKSEKNRYVEVMVIDRKDFVASATNGILTRYGIVKSDKILKIGYLKPDGRLYYASRNLDEDETLTDIAEEPINSPYNPLNRGFTFKNVAKGVSIESSIPFEAEFVNLRPKQELTTEVREIIKTLTLRKQEIKRAEAEARLMKSLKIYANSEGTSFIFYHPLSSISIDIYSTLDELYGYLPTEVFYEDRSMGLELLKEIESGKIAPEYRDVASSGLQHLGLYLMENAMKRMKEGKSLKLTSAKILDVVLAPIPAGYAIHEGYFGHKLEGTDFTRKLGSEDTPPPYEMVDKVSPYKMLLDKALQNRDTLYLGDENITVIDSPIFRDSNGFYSNALYPFSDDGMKARDKILVKNGELVGVLTSRIDFPILNKWYGKLGIDLYPCNAHVFQSGTMPLTRTSTTYLLGTKNGPTSEEMLEMLPNGGLFVRDAVCGRSNEFDDFEILARNVSEKRGEDLIPLKGCYLISHRLHEKVTSFSLAGKMLVGNEKEFKIMGGWCVKFNPLSGSGESIPNAVGAPYLYLSKVFVLLE